MCVQREGKPALKQILLNKYTLDSTKRPWSLHHYLIKTRIIAHHKCGYSFTILHADGIKTRGKEKKMEPRKEEKKQKLYQTLKWRTFNDNRGRSQ